MSFRAKKQSSCNLTPYLNNRIVSNFDDDNLIDKSFHDHYEDNSKDDDFYNSNISSETIYFDKNSQVTASPTTPKSTSTTTLSPSPTATKSPKLTSRKRIKENFNEKFSSSSTVVTNGSLYANIIKDKLIIATSIFFLISILLCCFNNGTKLARINTFAKKSAAKCIYKRFQSEYPQQDTLIWSSLEKNLQKVLMGGGGKKDYNVYLFVEDEQNEQSIINNRNNSNDNLVQYDFINNILKHYEQCLEQKIPVVYLNLNTFKSTESIEDYGNILKQFRNSYAVSRIIRIPTLNKIPKETAFALHAICDTYNPMFNEATLILLHLIAPPIKGHFLTEVENKLFQIWSSNESDNTLRALITRLTDQVINLQKKH